MPEIKLQAQKRTIVGKKVKNLRSQGLVPANVYGKQTKSIAVSLKKDELERVFHQAGETGVVQLTIEGEKEQRPILVQNLQTDPINENILHADLRQIILTEKIEAMIPLELVGEAPAVAQKLGILIQPVSEVEVEALPMDLPEKFVIDVSKLVSVGDEIKLKDLEIDQKKVTVKTEGDLVVAKIDPLAAEEIAPPPVEETVAEEEASAEGGEESAETKVDEEEKTESSEE